MTTATMSYAVEHERCGDGYDWHVVRGGDVWDSCRTRAEAEAEAARLDRQERCEALRESIAEAIEDVEDPAALEAALALLRK